jgi:hypothetical protein
MFFEKIYKTQVPMQAKNKREKTQNTNIKKKREDVTTNTMGTKRIIKECYEPGAGCSQL